MSTNNSALIWASATVLLGVLVYFLAGSNGPIAQRPLQIAAGSSASAGGDFVQQGTAARARSYLEKARDVVSVKDFGATGSCSATNAGCAAAERAAIQAAINYAVTNGKKLIAPGGKYVIDKELTNLTSDLWTSNPTNGLVLEGDGVGKTIIKACSLPCRFAPGPLLNLDGNVSGSTDNNNPRAQVGNRITNITFDGNKAATRGIRIRANVLFHFADLDLADFVGGANDAGIIIVGVVGRGQDDADTTFQGTFERVRIDRSTGYCMLGISNRSAAITIKDSDFRNCRYDGLRLAFAGLTIIDSTFAINGQVGANSGGFSAVQAATGARTRGLTIIGSQFESNFWYDINLEYVYGATISGFTIHPYHGQTSAYDQKVFDIGAVAADGIKITGGRIQEYTTNGWYTTAFNLRSGASNVSIDSVSINDPNKNYVISSEAKNISRDGYRIGGYVQSGDTAYRIENTFRTVLEGASGVGLEVGTYQGESMLQSYDRTKSSFAPINLTGSALNLNGQVNQKGGYVQSGDIAYRIENTFQNVPGGGSGMGLEMGSYKGDFLLQSYNRTNSQYTPINLTASAIKLNGPVIFGHNEEPTCNSANRGALVLVQGIAGVADKFRVCTKDAAGAYGYRDLY